MQRTDFIRAAGLCCAVLLLFGGAVWAQQLAQRPRAPAPRTLVYDASRETVLEGTVLTFSTENATPPGAHVVLQTPSGAVDAHLGPASYLRANQFSLATGDVVKVVGAIAATGQSSLFLARVIQKGGRSLVLRTPQGAPLGFAGARARNIQKTAQQGGAR